MAGLESAQTAAHIHGPAVAGSSAGVLYTVPVGECFESDAFAWLCVDSEGVGVRG